MVAFRKLRSHVLRGKQMFAPNTHKKPSKWLLSVSLFAMFFIKLLCISLSQSDSILTKNNHAVTIFRITERLETHQYLFIYGTIGYLTAAAKDLSSEVAFRSKIACRIVSF